MLRKMGPLMALLLVGLFLHSTSAQSILDESFDTVGMIDYMEINPETVYMRDGDDLRASCYVIGEEANYYTPEWREESLDGRQKVIADGEELFLRNVYRGMNQLDRIFCYLRSRTDGSITDMRKQLRVIWDPSSLYNEVRIPGNEYRINIDINPETIRLDEPVRMQCSIQPVPSDAFYYKWFLNGQLLRNGPVHNIPRFGNNDIGNYTCSVEWTGGNGQPINYASSININMGGSPPRDRVALELDGGVSVVYQDDYKELHCDGKENERGGWYFDGVPIGQHPSVNQSGRLSVTNHLSVSVLAIHKALPEHNGEYSCIVNGQRLFKILRIEGYNIILNISPEKTEVQTGDSAEIHCSVDGSQDFTIASQLKWYFRPFNDPSDQIRPLNLRYGNEPNYDNVMTRLDDGMSSYISTRDARPAMSGYYYCRMDSGREVIAELSVLGGSQPSNGSVNLIITPPQQTVQINGIAEFECFNPNRDVSPLFRVDSQLVDYNQVPLGNGRSTITLRNIRNIRNGTWVECYVQGLEPVRAYINLEAGCPQNYRRCDNGQCIHPASFCDGKFDCSDRSDESQNRCRNCDPVAKKCEHYNGRAPLKQDYMIHWECDGEDDCGNGFDERSCPVQGVRQCVQGVMHQCRDTNSLIPKAFICDKENDCQFGSDEESCMAPDVMSNPIKRYRQRLGSTVTLTCRVTGNPPPRVIWRFNWGCLREDPYTTPSRFTQESNEENCSNRAVTVISTLTIRNIQNGDDGIYNCEALSGSNRALSEDFYLEIDTN